MAKDKVIKVTPKKEAMLKALPLSLGVVTDAAKSVGIAPKTHYAWLKDDPEYKAAVEGINEQSIDFVESKLFQSINGYEVPETKVFCTKDGDIVTHDMKKQVLPDVTAMIFYLKTKGKKRGYIESQRIAFEDKDGNIDNTLKVSIVPPDGV